MVIIISRYDIVKPVFTICLYLYLQRRQYPFIRGIAFSAIQFVSSSVSPFYPAGTGEGLRLAKEKLAEKNVYFVNPSFDR